MVNICIHMLNASDKTWMNEEDIVEESSVLCSVLGQNLNFQKMFWDKPLSLK